jgi:uncharacterized protein (DUF305 family)
MHSSRARALLVGLVLLVLVLGSLSLFTPLLGRARFGPMRGFEMSPMGPMGMGMMREVHAMADVETEVDYMVRMIPHHQEAVDSARVLLERTERTEMQQFARDIIATQSRQIEQMRSWLAAWYPDRDRNVAYEDMMRDYFRLSGDRLDLAFLQDMIPHHMAAVMMSQQLLSGVETEHPELDELATSIRATQTAEIRQMGLWMNEWFN